MMAEYFSDAEKLNEYFEQHSGKLNFYTSLSPSVEQAVVFTRRESQNLLDNFRLLAHGIGHKTTQLDEMFLPLHKDDAFSHSRYATDTKAKGSRQIAPWIRLYAVKCDINLYVLTGYAIKLVPKMQDDPDLLKELRKLDSTTTYLRKIQMISQ